MLYKYTAETLNTVGKWYLVVKTRFHTPPFQKWGKHLLKRKPKKEEKITLHLSNNIKQLHWVI
jgi:hypothetical protein